MRIAHISDLHALDLHGVSPLRFLNKRLLGGINLLRKRAVQHPLRLLDALCRDLNRMAPDHIVVSGDLSNLSLPSEFVRVRQALDSLRLGPDAVSVIPGNHDVYVKEAQRQQTFLRALGPYCQGDGQDPATEPRFPFVRRRGEVAIVGCSTARPSPPPLADGRLGLLQLAAIEQALTEQAGHFRLLLIHHPPIRQRHDLLRGLRDRGALQDILKRHGCELIVHGHEHRDLRGSLPGPDGPIPVIGVGSGTFADPRPDRRARYNIYTIGRQPPRCETPAGRFSLTVDQRIYDPAQDDFAAPS